MDARPYDKLFHLNNAKALLQSDDLQSLRYASLEMRYFLEAHVYERLFQGVGTLPRSVIDKWEPNKAMKLLAMFDQYSDMDLRITISENDGSNPLTIDYPNIDNKTLSQQYNALGSFLHLPQPRKAADYKVKKSKLDAIYTSLERLTTGNLIIYSIPYETFNCEACDQPILYTNHYIHNQKTILCQNDNCLNEHHILIEEPLVKFGSKIILPCGKCETDIEIFYSNMKIDSNVTCHHCKTEYTGTLVFRADEK